MPREFPLTRYGRMAIAPAGQDVMILDELPVLHRPVVVRPAPVLAGAGD